MKELRKEDSILQNVKRIHMIGIGGSGMCPLAEILHGKGYILTGSDNNESDPLNRVKNLGIKVFMGHNAENLGDCELVVYSAAISEDNPEIKAAKERNIPLMERSHLLGALTRYYDNVIGVCGTHGKTTTTSIITQVLVENKCDPTAVIGGYLPLINSNGRIGKSDIMVCESCEFVDTFLQMSPDISVLLNVDNDHLEYFKTMENLTASFSKFIGMSKYAFVNGDDKRVISASETIKSEVITFGFNENNFYRATDIKAGPRGFSFSVNKNGKFLSKVSMNIPGRHNVYNGLAAFAVCDFLSIPADKISESISGFYGAGRRFEFLGEYGGFTLADDYAHHPTEIAATLKAAKELPYNNVIAVFQPFTFSRTAMLLDDFVEALKIADKVILTPIMGSREKNTYGVSSEQIAEKLDNCVIVSGFENIADKIIETAKENDLVITMGGGDIYKAAHIVQQRF